MSARWHFYEPATGVLHSSSYMGPSELLELNTPEGFVPIAGHFDATRQRIDLVTLQAVDFQPPAPADTEWFAHVWDSESREWVPQPTDQAKAQMARERRARLLAECDWIVARAIERSEPVPDAWSDYRQALRDVPSQPSFPSSIEWPVPPAST